MGRIGRVSVSVLMQNRIRRAAFGAALFALIGCDRTSVVDPNVTRFSLDAELRSALGRWGAVPIGDVPTQSPAVVALGQSLFFDKILSGNRDVSCATCHDLALSATDGRSLAIGTGAIGSGSSRVLGPGRRFASRNAPTMVNAGLGFTYILWDGRISQGLGFFTGTSTGAQGGNSSFQSPAGVVLPPGLANILAAQAMLPVLNRVEMRGDGGDRDVNGNVNELANLGDTATTEVWNGIMRRLLAIQEYAAKFSAAFPAIPPSSLGFQDAANAIAAFQLATFTRHDSPFDRYLDHDNGALTDDQKRGGILFFGSARCSTCHSGPMLGGDQFANTGAPQIGPGVNAAAPLDIGRAEVVGNADWARFAFRVPPLRNVELTAPYMHDGAYRTLESVVRHYTNPDSALRAYDPSQLEPALRPLYHGDAATIAAVSKTIDFRVKSGVKLTDEQQRQIIAFLKSLTDQSARDMSSAIPASVPSGLAVR